MRSARSPVPARGPFSTSSRPTAAAKRTRASSASSASAFIPSFMVADHVEVATRRAGERQAWLWTSDGKGAYQIAPAQADDAPAVGARVTLHLNAESDEFLDAWRIESLRARTFGRDRRADRSRRGAGRGAAPHRRRRRFVDEAQIRHHGMSNIRISTASSPASSTSRR